MKVYMETLGCPKNFNDTQTAKGIMTAEGITITDDAENSDVMILNMWFHKRCKTGVYSENIRTGGT